ncbi:MAG: 2-amino-4-hydroxy-6-hydroxymethyldihydropteridine diphosphokinase [Bacillota bacterium]|nr:2-amino-4-hydroxy-6-hydroxymethyldihydropteridine diphosphokinase [Bacillota bacterium]
MAYLGLGANQGERETMLARAVARLHAHPAVRIVRWSSLYETEPVGPEGQGWYLNAVLEVETSLCPVELLGACKQIERDLGRRPGVRWGPRLIDIDIELFGRLRTRTRELELPHPELPKRAFVLVPLAEVAPEAEIPGLGSVRSVLAGCNDPHRVRFHRGPVWLDLNEAFCSLCGRGGAES